MRKYTDPQRTELIRQATLMRANGKSWNAIAGQLGTGTTTIDCFRRDHRPEWDAAYAAAVALIGEVPHHRAGRVSTASIDTAARMHAEGKLLEEIAAHFGITANHVAVWRAQNRQRWDTAYLAASEPFGPPTPLPPRQSDPSKPTRSLWAIAEAMFGRKANIRSDKTAKHYRYSINSFGKHLGRLPTEADLDDDSLIAWMGELQRGPGSTTTGRTYLERIRALWRFLNDRGEIGTRPSFSLPPIPEPTPLALDESQLRRLFESAVCRPGLVCGVPARYWWPALFGFVFCTSERRGATLALQWQWVDLNSRAVSFPAAVRKGGLKAATYRLWPEVVDLLERIAGSNRELVFPWEKSEATFYHHYGKILVDAQIPDDRRHKLQGLRVTHNTWTKVMTGRHSPLLMHSSSATSERHYEDKRYTVREAVKLLIPWRSPAMAEAESAPVVALNINDREVRKLPRARVLSGKAVS